MSWLFIVVIAHFFSAGVFIIDRYLLKRSFPSPLNYAFYVGILSIFVLLLVPFGFFIPETGQIILSFITGIIWLIAIIVFYTALYKGESSRVVPIIGGLIPLFTLVLSFVFLGERLSYRELIAFCFLVGGGVILSFLEPKARWLLRTQKIYLTKAFVPALGAALFFAIYFVMTKFIFVNQGFINGIIWIRLGAVLASLFLLIPRSFRKMIFEKSETTKAGIFGLFVSARGASVLSTFLIYWAIFLGSVTLVNALQGTQYIFLLLLAFLLFRKIPSLKEQFDKRVLMQKIFAIFLICLGLAILVL